MTSAKVVQFDEFRYRVSELVTIVIIQEAKPFILDGTPKTLDEYIVDGSTSAIHTDVYVIVF